MNTGTGAPADTLIILILEKDNNNGGGNLPEREKIQQERVGGFENSYEVQGGLRYI